MLIIGELLGLLGIAYLGFRLYKWLYKYETKDK